MKRVLGISLLLTVIFTVGLGQTLKPYILGAQSSEDLQIVKEMTRSAIQEAGFSVLGEYQPAQDETRWIFVINSPGIIEAVQSVGELTGFAAALRVALTLEGGLINISYTNPIYLGNAYFQKNYSDVAHYFMAAEKNLATAMTDLGTVKNEPFGVAEGLTAKEVGH